MSETLIGVIVGGVIASLTPVIGFALEFFKSKRERRINNLKEKRNRLEKLYSKTYTELLDAVDRNLYQFDLLSNFEVIFPENVSKAFDDLIKQKEKTDMDKKRHLLKISMAMKASLIDIEKEIEK